MSSTAAEAARERRAKAPARTATITRQEAIRQLPWSAETSAAFLDEHHLVRRVIVRGEEHTLVLWGDVLDVLERDVKQATGAATSLRVRLAR